MQRCITSASWISLFTLDGLFLPSIRLPSSKASLTTLKYDEMGIEVETEFAEGETIVSSGLGDAEWGVCVVVCFCTIVGGPDHPGPPQHPARGLLDSL